MVIQNLNIAKECLLAACDDGVSSYDVAVGRHSTVVPDQGFPLPPGFIAPYNEAVTSISGLILPDKVLLYQ